MGSFLNGVISVSLFGESHGTMIGATIDNLAPGIFLDLDFISKQAERRKAKGKISTQRHEADEFQIISGYFNGYTTGAPLTVLIPNTSTHSKDYSQLKDLPRPSHADFTAYEKYDGFQDYRGGGHFSGRLTAPLVIIGAICQQILRDKDIQLGTHILKLGDIHDTPFANVDENELANQLATLSTHAFPTIDESIGKAMQQVIEKQQETKDSIGGILQSSILHMPSGIGEPFFHSLESELSSLLFSIPAVKGVEFGLGFNFVATTGSQANDAFTMKNERVVTTTNNNGGINGGISNGMPIQIQTIIKPTASIFQPQQTINYQTKENATLNLEGRHDPAIVHRAAVVVDSVLAIGLLNSIATRYGYMWMRG